MSVAPSLRRPVKPGDLSPAEEVDASPIVESDAVFPQSVASGGPTPNGVILWTRLAPEVHRSGASITATVASDHEFESLVTRCRIPAREFGHEHDHTVRVDLDGELEPDTRYYYRFQYDGVDSRIGRCRTLPGASASPDNVTLAVLSCQDYRNGYYGALSHIAREDVDFVLHLGDYIYEAADRRYRAPTAGSHTDRRISLPSGHAVAHSLEDFRSLYRVYRTDRSLQAAHERHTFIRCWDDHAIADNRYWDYGADAPVAPGHPRGDDPDFMRRLTAAGIQAWWEYTPARIGYDPDATHLHDSFRLWRHLEFGDLVSLVLTDERLFRSPPPGAGEDSRWLPDPPRLDPARSMLGDEQRAWFLDAIRGDEARWTVWGNEVLSMPFRVGFGRAAIHPNLESWDGYPHERDRIFAALEGAENAVTLTGDMHSTIAGYQRLPTGARAGVEFMTPAVSSVNVAEAVGVDGGVSGRVTRPVVSGLVSAMNPHVEYFDSHHWGYSVVEFTRDACTFSARSVDKSSADEDAARRPLARFRVPAGSIEIQRRSPESIGD